MLLEDGGGFLSGHLIMIGTLATITAEGHLL